jgi:iron complex outermembrane receptor protein
MWKVNGGGILRILCCVALGLALLSLPALGEEASSVESPPGQEAGTLEDKPVKVDELPEIEVRSFAEKAATSTVITKDDISLGPYQNLPGYLEEQAGLDMTRRSLLGVKANQVSIRGFDEGRYQVYLNGRSWKGSGVKGGFFVDWSTITPEDLERLEIIRGPLSAEYPNTLGGVITINTQRGSKEPKVYLDTYWGSWATQSYRFLTTGSHGPVQYALGATYGNSDGYLRNNFIRDRGNFSGSFTYTCPCDLSLTGAARYFTQETGLIVYNRPDSPFYNPNYPDSDADWLYGPNLNFLANNAGYNKATKQWDGKTAGDNSYVHTQRYELDLEAKQKFWHGAAECHLFYFQAIRDEFYFAMNNPSHLIAKRRSWDEDTWGWNFKVRQTPGKVRLGFGLEGNYFGFGGVQYSDLDKNYFSSAVYNNYITLPPSPRPIQGMRNAQKLHGGFVDAAVPLTRYFELYLGLRYDNYDAANPGIGTSQGLRADFLSPKCTLTIRPTDTTEAYLSANYSAHFPNLTEWLAFWVGASVATRQPVLSPEFGMQYEAGITQRLPWNSLVRVRGYYYDINDYIRQIFNPAYSPGGRVVYNLDLATIRGVEVEGQIPLPYNLTAFANYTWQQTSTSGDPLAGGVQKLTEYPEHKANIGLKYKAPNGAEGKISLRLVSQRAQYTVSGVSASNVVTGVTLRPMKGFFNINLEGRYPVIERYGVKTFAYFGVQNLTGEFYEESAGYPMPTTTIYGGLQARY